MYKRHGTEWQAGSGLGQAEWSKPGKLETGTRERQEHGKTAGRLDETNKLATNREHRYKYTGDNGEDW